MIFCVNTKLKIGSVVTAAYTQVGNVRIDNQPVRVMRKASLEEYLNANPQDRLLSVDWTQFHFYEVETD